ncbi:MAG: RimJ/RimL family protein N-acetyltransferase [Nitriliruptoraceae bacterium]|jgi:RimJ/RimL family protein N-acetyltransferase
MPAANMAAPTPVPQLWPLPGHTGVMLRPPALQDVAQLVAAGNDPDVQRFTRLPAPFTEDDARAMVQLAADQHATGTGIQLLAMDGDVVLGTVGLPVDRRDHTAEVGYWFAPAGRGRGICTAVVREAVRHAIEACGVQMMYLVAATDNPGSARVAERVGFRKVGVLRLRATVGPTGDPSNERSDMTSYDLLPADLI